MTLHRLFCCFVFLLFLLSTDTSAQQRGIKIQYRAKPEQNASVAGSVNLYPHSYALVIGNDAYSNGWSRLSNAVKDANEVAKALKDIGFDVTVKTDLSSRNFSRTIEDWIIQKGRDPEARLFLWYAGHGHTSGGEGYIVPVDAPAPGGDDYDFRIAALNMRNFGTWVRTARSKHVYAIFDSCFAGTVFDTARAAPPPAITLAATKPVRQFLTSGGADQTVADDGTFRELFIDALKGKRKADANGDGYLTASELGLFMSDRVTNYSEGKQTPKYGKLRDKRYDIGDFIFAQVGDVARERQPTPVAARSSAQPPSTLVLEAQEALKEMGYDLPVNGIFDERTRLEVIRFEKDKNYSQTGLIDAFSLEKMRKALTEHRKQEELKKSNVTLFQAMNYLDGRNGYPKDAAKGLELLQSAVDQGNEWALARYIGELAGGKNMRQDYVKARELAEKSVNHLGQKQARGFLAMFLWYGLGGQPDKQRALRLYRQLANEGDQTAIDTLSSLRKSGVIK